MRKHFLFILVITSVVISSCGLGNLYPISENKNDFIFRKEFLGKWGEQGNNWVHYIIDTVKGSDGKTYRAAVIDRNEDEGKTVKDTSWFLLGVVKLNNQYFIDCQFDMESNFPQEKDDYSSWLLARHFIIRFSIIGPDKIELIYPNQDEFLKLINEKKLGLTYYNPREDDYLILNKPAELQAALKESLKYSKAFSGDHTVLVRLK